ncbi:MAG: SDR family oxidoreductase [Actinobacteria bacterium]|nr:SDR family oxidoreductase [Actinomycetota bacterium]
MAASGGTVSVIARFEPGESLGPDVRHAAIDVRDLEALETGVADLVASGGPMRNLVLLQRFRGEGDAWERELTVSVAATKIIIEAVSRAFEGGGGSIVIVCSNASRMVAEEQPVGYHVAKAALRQMCRYYAAALGPLGIRVNCVTPGAVSKGASGQSAVADATPLRRLGTPGDIAGAVAFLCSDDASFITGQDLVVDGGLSLLWQESLVRSLTQEDG